MGSLQLGKNWPAVAARMLVCCSQATNVPPCTFIRPGTDHHRVPVQNPWITGGPPSIEGGYCTRGQRTPVTFEAALAEDPTRIGLCLLFAADRPIPLRLVALCFRHCQRRFLRAAWEIHDSLEFEPLKERHCKLSCRRRWPSFPTLRTSSQKPGIVVFYNWNPRKQGAILYCESHRIKRNPGRAWCRGEGPPNAAAHRLAAAHPPRSAPR